MNLLTIRTYCYCNGCEKEPTCLRDSWNVQARSYCSCRFLRSCKIMELCAISSAQEVFNPNPTPPYQVVIFQPERFGTVLFARGINQPSGRPCRHICVSELVVRYPAHHTASLGMRPFSIRIMWPSRQANASVSGSGWGNMLGTSKSALARTSMLVTWSRQVSAYALDYLGLLIYICH